jgi:hypothetical protein
MEAGSKKFHMSKARTQRRVQARPLYHHLESPLFSAFIMLVKWHIKSYVAKYPTKHPRCFHDYSGHRPPST